MAKQAEALALADLLKKVNPDPWRKTLKAWREYVRQRGEEVTLPKLKCLEDVNAE